MKKSALYLHTSDLNFRRILSLWANSPATLFSPFIKFALRFTRSIPPFFFSLFFLFTDGASGETCVPFVTPSTLLLSSRGRVKFQQSSVLAGEPPPAHLSGYLAPEYRPNKQYSDTEIEKVMKPKTQIC